MTRQRHTRVRRRLKVAVSCKGRQLEAVSGNLSQSGMLIHSSEVLQPGVAISGALQLEEESLAFSALVRWSRTSIKTGPPVYSMGLEFLATPGKSYYRFVKVASRDPSTAAEADTSEVTPPQIPLPAPPSRSSPTAPFHANGAAHSNGVAHNHVQRPSDPIPPRPSAPPRSPAPIQSATTAPGVPGGMAVGLSGRAEGSTRASGTRTSGTLPLAPSSAAPLFERAAVAALPATVQTIGVSLQVFLIAPPTVTIGAKLEAVATLIDVSPRKLRFRIELREGERLVATGEHERLVQ